jgi:hypothetical protein
MIVASAGCWPTSPRQAAGNHYTQTSVASPPKNWQPYSSTSLLCSVLRKNDSVCAESKHNKCRDVQSSGPKHRSYNRDAQHNHRGERERSFPATSGRDEEVKRTRALEFDLHIMLWTQFLQKKKKKRRFLWKSLYFCAFQYPPYSIWISLCS